MNASAALAAPAAPAPSAVSATSTGLFAAAIGYSVRCLLPEHRLVSQFVKLNQHVIAGLKPGEKHWVKRRLYADIRKQLENGHVALGVFCPAGSMVGQVLLTLPDQPGVKNLKGYPIGTGMLAEGDCMVVQALGVHTQHQGKGIRTLLMREIEAIAASMGRRHLLAKTDVKNTASVSGFEKASYRISPETSVEGETYQCVFAYKQLPAQKLRA